MSLSCRIKNGQVFAPNNSLSILYQSLEDTYGKEDALKRYALTETDNYKDSLVELDVNGEMTLESFNKFSYKESDTLFPQETLDFQLRSGSEGLNKLKSTLIINGLPIITEETLKATNLFTLDEINYILNNSQTQKNLEDFLQTAESNSTEVLEDNYLVLSSSYNSLGIKPYLNPTKVKEEVLSILSQATQPSEVTELISTIEYPSIIDNYKNNQVFRNKIIEDALNHKEVEQNYDEDEIQKTILNTLDVSTLDSISTISKRVLEVNDKDILDQEFLNLLDVLKSSGLDIKNDTFTVVNLSVDKIKKMSTYLFTFSQKPSEENVSKLNTLTELFNLADTKLINISNIDSKVNNLVYRNSTKSEVELFEEGLIKHGENVYQKIDDKYSTDQLYEILYGKLLNQEILLSTPSVDNQAQLLEPLNKEVVIKDIKEAVQEKTKDLGQGYISILEKIAIYKTYYNAPNIKKQSTAANPVVNEEYLTTDFVSDFSKIINDNKSKDTNLYKSFLQFFKVSKKGVSLQDSSKYVQEHIKNIDMLEPQLKNDLVNYSFLSKSLDLGFEQSINPSLSKTDIQRLEVVQNPETLEKYKGNSRDLTETDIIVKDSTSPFLNIKGRVYEKTMQLEENSVYSVLPIANKIYNQTDVSRPLPNLSTEDLIDHLSNEDVNIEANNIIGNLELEEINKNYFQCN